MKRVPLVLLALLVLGAGGALAVTQIPGRIGPKSRIQPNGRKLHPFGKLTPRLGNFPAGGAVTPNGRFLYALSAGRGRNDIRVVSLKTRKVVQILPMPGLDGGIAIAPNGRTVYVSGLQDSEHKDQQTPATVPGREGDVIEVLHATPRTGKLAYGGTIPVPPPSNAPNEQSFPPTPTKHGAWPRDIAISADGKRLLVALNLADSAAIVDTATKAVRYVSAGSYPYGAAILRDGRTGLVSNEADGTVTVIDLDAGTATKTIQVGPRLSHPEGIAADPKADRAYVAVANQDLVTVVDTKTLTVLKTLSVERPQGLGTSPTAVSTDGRRLLVADSGEDAIAVFALPRLTPVGRVPTAAYPTGAWRAGKQLVWLSGKGLGVGPNPNGPNPLSPNNTDDHVNTFQYLPSILRGIAGVAPFPGDKVIRRLTPGVTRQLQPINAETAPPGSPIGGPGPSSKIKHVFYVVKENRSYDQVMGDEAKGDGDPKLTLFGRADTPNQHALADRFGLLDHVYANSEASIDGHFWTSAVAVSDYVVKNWMQNYAARDRPYDVIYAITWPGAGFLFDNAQKQGIPYFNFGEALGAVAPLPDRNRDAAQTAQVTTTYANSDIGVAPGCYGNDASIGKDAITGVEVYDSSLPAGAPPGSTSRIDCFRQRFQTWMATNSVPSFMYMSLPSDHTVGTSPGDRTPRAMIADNDLAVGQLVDTISHSSIWKSSLILVMEDDSQNGADHVDAHRIPALAISPYSRRGAVVHTRYDFPSFARTLENAIGMKPLNLFDALAVPLYDVFTASPDNSEPYAAITPARSLTERNGPGAPGARQSRALGIGEHVDAVPQRVLDKILWQSVHGAGSVPPPPGPNASGQDTAERDADG